MSDTCEKLPPVSIEEELKSSYLDYAMSVIVGRALPDVRDGLKRYTVAYYHERDRRELEQSL